MQPYSARRKRLGQAIGKEAVALVPGAVLSPRNADNDHLFRQASGFYHLTGFNEPDALLVIEGGERPRSTLFCAPKDPKAELWHGQRFGVTAAKSVFGVDATHANAPECDVAKRIFALIRRKALIYCNRNETGRAMPALKRAIDRSLAENSRQSVADVLEHLIGEMRIIKDATEIALIRKAAEVSAQAHREILSLARPGMTEYEIEAELTYRFRKSGGHPYHAYPPIVASGANACTLHYNENARTTAAGDLVLVDAGCELGLYASDITRTFPVSGRFSAEQRAIYEIVLAAQKAALVLARPGVPFSLPYDASALVVAEGLMRLGLMERRDPHKAIAEGRHRAFYPHGVGHFLGLDVHDAGDYLWDEHGRKTRLLEAGMVITVEPGIYIQPNIKRVDKRWLGIGVRIEDDVLITEGGNEILTKDAPKEIGEIEAIMNNRRSSDT